MNWKFWRRPKPTELTPRTYLPVSNAQIEQIAFCEGYLMMWTQKAYPPAQSCQVDWCFEHGRVETHARIWTSQILWED